MSRKIAVAPLQLSVFLGLIALVVFFDSYDNQPVMRHHCVSEPWRLRREQGCGVEQTVQLRDQRARRVRSRTKLDA
jgi:hypothetical protein